MAQKWQCPQIYGDLTKNLKLVKTSHALNIEDCNYKIGKNQENIEKFIRKYELGQRNAKEYILAIIFYNRKKFTTPA